MFSNAKKKKIFIPKKVKKKINYLFKIFKKKIKTNKKKNERNYLFVYFFC